MTGAMGIRNNEIHTIFFFQSINKNSTYETKLYVRSIYQWEVNEKYFLLYPLFAVDCFLIEINENLPSAKCEMKTPNTKNCNIVLFISH